MAKAIIKNFSWVFFAQIIVLLISIGRAIILPKYLSVDAFGYWELYWFYSSYVALFCLGYNDGIYLQYGECNYSQLPLQSIRSSNRLFLKILTIIAIFGILLLLLLDINPDTRLVFIFVVLNIPIVCITGVLIYIYQITNQFRQYSFFSVIDKILVFFTIIALIIFDELYYPYIIVADFFGRLMVVGLMITKRKDMFIGEVDSIKESWIYLLSNAKVGIRLMIANLMGMLLIGAGKIIVQVLGNISDFAEYSFGLSITGLVLTAVTAISLVLYPTIKRITSEKYAQLFCDINALTRLLGFLSLLIYFPCLIFVEYFYPKYISVLPYMNFFFVIVFANIKISVVNNTFYKVLRKEKEMLKANMGCIVFFCITCMSAFYFIPKIYIIALFTAIALLMRCILSEIYLSKELGIRPYINIIIETVFILIFCISTIKCSLYVSMIVTVVIFIVWNISTYRNNYRLIMRLLKI